MGPDLGGAVGSCPKARMRGVYRDFGLLTRPHCANMSAWVDPFLGQ